MEQGGLAARGSAIREVPGGYLLFCDQITSDGNYQTHAMVRRLGPDGEELSVRDYLAGSARHSNHGLVDPVCRMTSGTIASPVLDDSTGYDRRISILIFNDLGDTVITYRPIQCDPADSVVVTMRGIEQLSNGDFLLVGSVDSLPQELDTHALLARISPTGQLINATEYGVPGQLFAGVDVREYLDGGAVLFGYRGAPGSYDWNFLMRVDAEGQERWRRYFGYAASGSYGSVKLSADGGIVTWCRYDEPGGAEYYWKTLLVKWGAEGELIWQRQSNYGYQTSPFDMEILEDGTFIATATVDEKALLCKFTAEGDSLWTRTYSIYSHNANHVLWDVEPTSDGGLVACGNVTQSSDDPQPGLMTLWMIKTDGMGCVVPGCHTVGVQEYVLDLTEQLQVSPNPSRDHMQVLLPLPSEATLEGPVQGVLLDAVGAEVLRTTLPSTNEGVQGTMDVSGLAAGIYHLHLVDQRRWLAGGKVVVE